MRFVIAVARPFDPAQEMPFWKVEHKDPSSSLEIGRRVASPRPTWTGYCCFACREMLISGAARYISVI